MTNGSPPMGQLDFEIHSLAHRAARYAGETMDSRQFPPGYYGQPPISGPQYLVTVRVILRVSRFPNTSANSK